MIVSPLATALADRYAVDVIEEIASRRPRVHLVSVFKLLDRRISKDRILSCFFHSHEIDGFWKLFVAAERFMYRETAIGRADITLYDCTLPATAIIGISHRSIPITRIIEPSSTLDPFFLRDDVIVESARTHARIEWRAIPATPALTFVVTF